MGGSSPYPGRTQSHPCPSHLTRGQEEGGAAWIEVCPRNTMEEEEGDLGGMGGAIFITSLKITCCETFISGM